MVIEGFRTVEEAQQKILASIMADNKGPAFSSFSAARQYSNDEMLRQSYDWFLQHGASEGLSPDRQFVKESIPWLVRKVS
jgi:hypothetical protein